MWFVFLCMYVYILCVAQACTYVGTDIDTALTYAMDATRIDMDGDGQKDLVVASEDKITWYKNELGNGFGSSNTLSTDQYTYHISAVDLDNDNDLDILVVTDSDVAWYENDNGFTRNTIANIQASDPFADVAVGDLDGDGDWVEDGDWEGKKKGGAVTDSLLKPIPSCTQ